MKLKINQMRLRKMQNEIRYFSMFSGVGGFELGLESANNSSYSRGRKTKEELSSKGEDSIGQGNPQSIINESESNALYKCIGESEERTNDDSETRGQRQKENISEQGMSNSMCESKQRHYTCVGYSEIDKYSIQTYQKNFPGHKNYGDATKINPDELPDFDMLCGGFPCQSFSIAGKRRGFEDTRGTMFFEISRILKVKRPKTVFLENVKGLLNHNKGETFKVILQTLDELGYEVQWMVLNSKFFGVPQNRERVFIIGNLRGERRSEILPFRETTNETYPNIKRTQSDISGKGYSSQQDRVYRTEGIMACLPNANPDNKMNIITYPTLSTELAHSTGRDFFRGAGEKIVMAQLQRNKMIWSGRDIKTGKDNKNPLPEGHRIYDPEGIMQTVKPSPLKIKVKGILGGDTWEKRNDSSRRVYDTDGISPTIPTGTGGGVMTKIVEEKKLCAIHLLYPRSGNPKQGGTGHLTKEPNDTYCLDTGNMQGLEFRNIKVRKEIDNCGRVTEKTDGTSYTLGGGGRNNGRNQLVGFEDMKIRRLTPTECERLQGFPDGWTKWGYCGEKEEDCQMSDTQRYKQMGNAVTTNVIKAIGERL